MTGTFYGVGVGPGDPELLTVKALKVLKSSPVLAFPVSRDSASRPEGLALSIVKEALKETEDKEILRLVVPMTKDGEELRRARAGAAQKVVERLKTGSDVSFITLGDPMLYSTFTALVPVVKGLLPGVCIKTVPGVTSISAAAARAGRPIASTNEKVLIVPVSYDMEDLRGWIDAFDTVILMKVKSKIAPLVEMLSEEEYRGRVVFAARVGWPEEEIVTDLTALRGMERPDYLSMVIIKGSNKGE